MIVNLTQHPATPEQKEAGVFDLEGSELMQLKAALTFDDLPTEDEIISRAKDVAWLACSVIGEKSVTDWGHPTHAMIGGALWLMPALAKLLLARGIEPLFAFTKRETEEQVQPDGSVRKVAVFRHAGFVPVAK
jgi:hypothetical protein